MWSGPSYRERCHPENFESINEDSECEESDAGYGSGTTDSDQESGSEDVEDAWREDDERPYA